MRLPQGYVQAPLWKPGEVPVYTAKITRIPNERPLPRPPAAMRVAARLMKGNFPNADLRSSASTYNCAGLVLAFRRTCIDDLDSLPQWLIEDGYRQLSASEDVEPADVVVYRTTDGSIEHVGFVLEVPHLWPGDSKLPPRILSKWGKDGEYIHSLMDKPAILGAVAEYWTERQ